MCRLLGIVSASSVSIADAVGETVLQDFVSLTKIHGDGWGVARIDHAGNSPHAEVSAQSALGDPAFTTVTHEVHASAAIVHLRWATSGLAVEPTNSHPFVADGVAMAHNGSIKPIQPLEQLVEPSIAASIRGTTDSEQYFALIRQYRRTAPSLAEATRRAVDHLRSMYPTASLNALILGEDQLIAVHAHARSRLLDEDVAEISATDLPAEHLDDYFSLRIARPTENIVVVGSTGFGNLDWQPLPAESVTVISMHDLTLTTLALPEEISIAE